MTAPLDVWSSWARARTRCRPLLVGPMRADRDRKSTRLNSSHTNISYAVFCLKKKKKETIDHSFYTYHQATSSTLIVIPTYLNSVFTNSSDASKDAVTATCIRT